MKTRLVSLLVLLLPFAALATNTLNFDGVDDWVQTAVPANEIGSAFTLEAWVHPHDFSDRPIISTLTTSGNTGMELHLGPDSSISLTVRSSDNSWKDFKTPAGLIAPNTWIHAAATFDGTMATLYLNGYSISVKGTMSGSFVAGTELLKIGCRASRDTKFLGDISEVQVWTTVRTRAEIRTDMAGYATAQTNQLLYYTMDQGVAGGDNSGTGTGTILAVDLVNSAAHSGQLANFALMGTSSNWIARTMSTVSGAPAGTGTNADPYQIDSLPNLLWLSTNKGVWSVDNEFRLMKDIDASDTKNWNADSGFSPIGDNATSFDGVFHGNGNVIAELAINRPGSDSLGFFGRIGATGTVDSLGLQGATVFGRKFLGTLFGVNRGIVTHSFVTTGTVTSADSVQLNIGLLGGLNAGTISNSYARGVVSATGLKSGVLVVAGGLVANNSGTISQCYSMGSVTVSSISGNADAGGLVAFNSGVISHSFSMDTLTATASASFAIAGGITAWNQTNGKISNSYATGPIHTNGPSNAAGGIAGITVNLSTIDSSYAVGQIIANGGSSYIGGLAGYSMGGTANASYWDTQTTGQANAFGIGSGPSTGGLSTTAMMSSASFSNLDVKSIWFLYEGHTYPLLRDFMTPLTVTAKSAVSKVYDKAVFAGDLLSYSQPSIDASLLLGSRGAAENATTVGSYPIDPSPLYSSQLGYLITPVGSGTLTITAAPLTIAGVSASNKVYDGTTAATVTSATLAGKISGDDVTLTLGTASFATKDTGTAKDVLLSGYSIGGADAGNYTLNALPTLTANITARPVTITGVTASNKVYDGSTAATLSGGTFVDTIVGDALTLVAGVGAFDTKDVGTAKPISASGYSIIGTNASNYTLSAQPIDLSANITPKTIHVVATADTITTGTTGYALTYTYDSLLTGDSLTGELVCNLGNTAGTYAILIGTLTAGGNYTIDFASANFVITEPIVTPPEIIKSTQSLAFTGRTNASIFNLKGVQVWSGSLDVVNGQVKMPSIGKGRWVVKLMKQ